MAQSRSKKSTSSSKKRASSSASRSRSAAASKSRGSAARTQQPSRRAQRRAENPNFMPSILLAGLGLLCVAFVLVPGQNFWKTFREAYFGLFGIMSYLVGPFLLYLAYLLASGYRVGVFAAKVSLMGVLCSAVPVVFSRLNLANVTAWEAVKLLFTRASTYFWEGGVLGAPVGAVLLALFGRPASNVLVILIFLLGLMFFFAVSPVDVVEFILAQYNKYQGYRAERAARETAYDTPLFQPENDAETVENLTQTMVPDKPHYPAYDVMADLHKSRTAVPVQPAAPMQPAARRPDFDVDLGPQPTDKTLQNAVENDPLQPVNIGPGGTFGMDPLSMPAVSNTRSYAVSQPAPAPAQPAPQEDFELKLQPEPQPQPEPTDELDALINRAVSGHAPYYAPQEVGIDLPAEPTPTDEFDTPLQPVPAEPVQIAKPDMTGRVPGDTMVISPDALRAAAAAPAIPSLGGSFADANLAVKDAWQSGRPLSDILDDYTAPATPAAPAAQPARSGTEDSFYVPQGGEAAELRVSTAVGNSASAPVHTPPSAAKAAPEAMRLPTSDEQPPEPYCYPSLNLFNATKAEDEAGAAREMKKNADILVNTLDSFGVKTTMLDICRGPSVTRYELQPQAGIKVSRITSLADDIALNLATAGVRIEAPIPGKPAVGIEVPNKIRSTVNIRTVFESQNYINMRSPLTMALGKDIAGTAQVADLCKMPHLLIAGSTGSGKSVCVNSIIISFLFRSGPEDVKLILIDPKVVELAEYNGIPHLLMPVVTEPRKAAGALGASVAEMERRYKLFAENNVREIKAYNKLAARTGMEHLPYIAIIIDELADLMMVAGKEVEDYICRIAQKARAAGIHLIVATQRPSVDVITGLIKANIPSRIAFAVSSQIDSRTILDSGGAEKLLGYGDMLFLPVGASKPVRVQGTFVTDEEIGAVLSFIKSTSSAQYDEEMIAEMERRAVAEKGSKRGSDDDGDTGGALDPMFEQAVECVIEAGQASTSLLQRRCKLGYARAARIMDQMEQEKVIGPYEGAKPRAVLVTRAQWQERKLNANYDES